MRMCERKVVLLVEQNALRWFRHMKRMEEDQLVKKIVGSDVRGVRLRRKSRTG